MRNVGELLTTSLYRTPTSAGVVLEVVYVNDGGAWERPRYEKASSGPKDTCRACSWRVLYNRQGIHIIFRLRQMKK